ncbi:hypothetical protein D1872_81730 [compost metagenome]
MALRFNQLDRDELEIREGDGSEVTVIRFIVGDRKTKKYISEATRRYNITNDEDNGDFSIADYETLVVGVHPNKIALFESLPEAQHFAKMFNLNVYGVREEYLFRVSLLDTFTGENGAEDLDE